MAQAVNLDSRNPLVGIMYRISGIEKVNRFYEQINHLKGESFIEGSLDLLGLQLEFDEEELKRLPEYKPFITISNHPFWSHRRNFTYQRSYQAQEGFSCDG